MQISEMLLSEATALDYFGLKTTKYSKSDDVWFMKVDNRTIAVKAATLRVTSAATSVAAYKASSQPSIFNLIEMFDDGKVSKVIKNIPKPLNVLATVAEIIANETKDNKLNEVVLIRMPASMGTPKSVVNIINRYIKKLGVPFVQYGTINVGDKGTNYVFLSRVGKNPTLGSVFGIQDEDVKTISLNKIEEHPEVIEKIVPKLEAQIKKAMPTMIKLSQVVGSTPTSEQAREFIKQNPPSSANVDTSKLKEFKFKDIFSPSALEDTNVYMTDDNPTASHVASNIAQLSSFIQSYSIADTTESIGYARDIIAMKPTLKDFTTRSEKYQKIKEILIEEVAGEKEGERIMAGLFAHCIVEPISEAITNSYEDYTPQINSKDRASIERYCGSGYSMMNGVMMNGIITPHAANCVKEFDDAFESSGVRVSPELTVYRGSKMDELDSISLAIDKLFHFRSFVSTSLNPRVGFTFGGNDKTDIGHVLSSSTSVKSMDGTEAMASSISVAFMINRLDQIPVIIPGSFSPYPRECEVILPRGTTVRINEMIAGYANPSIKRISNFLFDTSVVPNSEISINEVIYDGDEFLKSGRLVEFSDFVCASLNEDKKKKTTSKAMTAANMMIAINTYDTLKKLTPKEKAEMERIAQKYGSKIM